MQVSFETLCESPSVCVCVCVCYALNRVCQSGGHDRGPEEADRGSDRHTLGQDCAQEMVRTSSVSRGEIKQSDVIIMMCVCVCVCVCVQVHHIQGPRVSGRLYPSHTSLGLVISTVECTSHQSRFSLYSR